MNWSAADYIAAALLIGGALAAVMVATRLSRDPFYRAGAALATLTALALLWSAGAVGIIGGSENDANMAFPGVVALAALGAFTARFRARGLVRAMAAAGAAQFAVGALALALGWGADGARWPLDIIAASLVFAGLWVLSAALFQRAASAGELREQR